MGWHDTLAVKSAELGKTSAEFRVGARRKAKAAVLYMIVTGAVGTFASWLWALVPGVLVVWSAFQSMSATMIASCLEVLEKR